jgi:hypothetical protein
MNVNPYESPQGRDGEEVMPGMMDRLLSWLRGRGRRNAYCSFCRKNYRDVGPLVEGPNYVYICHECCLISVNLIEAEVGKARIARAEKRMKKNAVPIIAAVLLLLLPVLYVGSYFALVKRVHFFGYVLERRRGNLCCRRLSPRRIGCSAHLLALGGDRPATEAGSVGIADT